MAKRVLVNDGIHEAGKRLMEEAGLIVVTEKVAQDQLISELPNYAAICVRSATKVRQELIDQCPQLQAIGRGGVGLDNIDVDYARSKGISVVNTPAASSRSVAELTFAHMLSCARSLYKSNRDMPLKGNSDFGSLKKSYSKGQELRGKTLGVIGMGRIGQETMKIAIGMGMKVVAHDPTVDQVEIQFGSEEFNASAVIKCSDKVEVLNRADFLTLHIPFRGEAVIGDKEFSIMKKGAILINAARGGVVDESAMLSALNQGILAHAGLDVFIDEPTPREDVLSHPNVSLTPHIGASTAEAQAHVGLELAEQIIEALK